MRVIKIERCILHVDMNNFFASVELLSHPELKDKPVAVAGDKEARHGIILAKNEIAKRYGVQTASPIWQAQRLCPDLILLSPHHDKYLDYSRRAQKIYENYTDQIEPFGIDEAWLDVTGSLRLFGSAEFIANEIRMRTKQELGLTCSVGISWNKVYAKLGSDLKKPDAVSIITRENYQTVVWNLPLNAILYAGKSTQKVFAQYGIHTIRDLAVRDRETAEMIAGKSGVMLWKFANGLDDSPVSVLGAKNELKSIGNSTTTPVDLCTNDDVHRVFLVLAEQVGARARAKHLKGRTLVIHMRESSKKLTSFERQCRLDRPTNITTEIADTAQSLFEASYDWTVPIRSLGIRLTDLCGDDTSEQLDLLTDETHRTKLETLDQTMDRIRKKFGVSGLSHGTVIEPPESKKEG